jgi:hypothetical protein
MHGGVGGGGREANPYLDWAASQGTRSQNRALTISDAISTSIPNATSPAIAISTLVMTRGGLQGRSQPALLDLGQAPPDRLFLGEG